MNNTIRNTKFDTYTDVSTWTRTEWDAGGWAVYQKYTTYVAYRNTFSVWSVQTSIIVDVPYYTVSYVPVTWQSGHWTKSCWLIIYTSPDDGGNHGYTQTCNFWVTTRPAAHCVYWVTYPKLTYRQSVHNTWRDKISQWQTASAYQVLTDEWYWSYYYVNRMTWTINGWNTITWKMTDIATNVNKWVY